MESLLELDRQLLLSINGAWSPWADSVMLFLSGIENWIPLYVLVAGMMFLPRIYGPKSFIHRAAPEVPLWTAALVSIAAALVCFGLTEQFSNLIKDSVCRLRPSHEPLLEGLVRLPEGKGGLYGFNSSHAADTIGFVTVTSLIFRRRWYSAVMYLWALLICYSRIYLAKHYPGDILAGILLGLLMGCLVHTVWSAVLDRLKKRRAAKPAAGG